MNRRTFLVASCIVLGLLLVYTLVHGHRNNLNTMYQQLRTQSFKGLQNLSLVKTFTDAKITFAKLETHNGVNTTNQETKKGVKGQSRFYERQYSKCKKKRQNVCFLKVHKCGSSTMANVMQRFTLRYNLNGVYPNKDVTRESFWILNRLEKGYSKQIIPIPEGEHYNTMFVHTVHDKNIFNSLFPNDTYYIAIVRDPVERFVSFSFYYKVVADIKKMYPNETSPYIFSKVLRDRPLPFRTHRVGPLYDFGYPTSKPFDKNDVRKFVEKIDKDYDFVMIMEYFDESLIYLRRQLCWDLSDILYLKRNVNSRKKNFGLTPNDRKLIRELQPDEVILYDFFYEQFWNILKEQPMSFFREVSNFKRILKEVGDFCMFRDKRKREEVLIAETQWNPSIRFRGEDCRQMEWLESYAIQFLGNRLREKYKQSVQHNVL